MRLKSDPIYHYHNMYIGSSKHIKQEFHIRNLRAEPPGGELIRIPNKLPDVQVVTEDVFDMNIEIQRNLQGYFKSK